MIESKPRSLKDVLEQAKTYSEVFQEWQLAKSKTVDGIDNKLLYVKWVSAGLVEQALSLLSEKMQKLRKLLENRPDIDKIGDESEYVHDLGEWFEKFVGEFEGLSEIVGDEEK